MAMELRRKRSLRLRKPESRQIKRQRVHRVRLERTPPMRLRSKWREIVATPIRRCWVSWWYVFCGCCRLTRKWFVISTLYVIIMASAFFVKKMLSWSWDNMNMLWNTISVSLFSTWWYHYPTLDNFDVSSGANGEEMEQETLVIDVLKLSESFCKSPFLTFWY